MYHLKDIRQSPQALQVSIKIILETDKEWIVLVLSVVTLSLFRAEDLGVLQLRSTR